MYHLVLDIGNTAIKVGLFQLGMLVHLKTCSNLDEVSAYLQNFDIERGIVSTVNQPFETIASQLPNIPLIDFATSPQQLVSNAYLSPDTLGADRLANAIGAVTLYPTSNVLVIDIGTCLKVDFTAQDSTFKGGSISPGLDMRYQALHTLTARLPLLEHSKPVENIGRNTNESITNGVFVGMCHEINGWMKQYSEEYKQLTIVGTGGSYSHFEPYLNYTIFAHPNLTLVGLHKTLQPNDN